MATRMAVRYVSRRFSSGGRMLSEEEKAAENIYIKKIEQEKLEKLARKFSIPGNHRRQFRPISFNMFKAAIRYFSTKPKPKMKPIELKSPPEQTQTITRAIFDIVKEHGPLTVSDTWEKLQQVGLRELNGKNHMKIVLRWMRQRQKLRLICNHIGPHKQFLYTTWFTKPTFKNAKAKNYPSSPKFL